MIKFDKTSDRIADLLMDLFSTEMQLLEAVSVAEFNDSWGEYFYGVEVCELEKKIRAIARELHKLKCFEFREWVSL